jgi:RHS repeat-associated protein
MTLPGTGGTLAFKYDGLGRRVQKVFTQGSSTTTTNYLYDGHNAVADLDQNGSVLARYAATRSIDEPLAELRSNTTSYYSQDGVGSVTSLTTSAGALGNAYTYDSFGNQTHSSGSIANRFQYTAREFDTEAGLYYYRARYYDPSTGRFLSEDPIRFKGGSNFYRYVDNRPVLYRDATGLLRDCDQEQIDCFNDCYKKPTKCLPWPVGRDPNKKVAKWSRYTYCEALCLSEYLECEADNAAQSAPPQQTQQTINTIGGITIIIIIIFSPVGI